MNEQYLPAAEAVHKPTSQLASLTATRDEDIREPLDVVAGKIRTLLRKSDDQRLGAAILLVEAYARVKAGEAGNISWRRWCETNLDRSPRDVRRLLAIGKADDPAAKLEDDRRTARQGMTRKRQRTNVSPLKASDEAPGSAATTDDPVAVAIRAVTALSNSERIRFYDWYRQTYTQPREPAACVADDLASHAPVDGLGLMAALDALQGDDRDIAYDWVMRGEALGHEKPTGPAGDFSALCAAASEDARKTFRSRLAARHMS